MGLNTFRFELTLVYLQNLNDNTNIQSMGKERFLNIYKNLVTIWKSIIGYHLNIIWCPKSNCISTNIKAYLE